MAKAQLVKKLIISKQGAVGLIIESFQASKYMGDCAFHGISKVINRLPRDAHCLHSGEASMATWCQYFW